MCESPFHADFLNALGRCPSCAEVLPQAPYVVGEATGPWLEPVYDAGVSIACPHVPPHKCIVCDPATMSKANAILSGGSFSGNTFVGTQTILTAPVPTPFPETDAFHQLLQDMAAGEVSIRDGLMRAYEAGRAERAAA